jgi:hypothetical protein
VESTPPVESAAPVRRAPTWLCSYILKDVFLVPSLEWVGLTNKNAWGQGGTDTTWLLKQRRRHGGPAFF